MNQNKLPADPLSLILGILALVIGIAGCCCYGITAIVPLAMAIIGLVSANKSLREFGENPEAFNPQSRSNVNTAKIINIIAIVLNGLVFLVAIGVLAIYGTLFSSAILEGLENGNFEEDDYYYESEYETTIEPESTETWEDETYIIEEEVDSINLDSIQ
ncbi:CCC motif membrane protein [Winogradskyella helgolandensis]|uniref:CCC motif membrane protein n=1 Tax=Winogradskyella helgolandensis TaxID=2697010 RepID=UPI0015BDAC2F|nr:CCC motif membrane protein [Winogradskyella helgolandensis]